jgi:DNA-binding transcriptional LysR family regulator
MFTAGLEDGEPLPGDQLAAFVAAADIGSIGGAADSLSLTQSAMTKRIQKLEARLGKPLLERRTGGVRPTEAGRALYPEARNALRALARAAQSVRNGAAESAAILRLAASNTVAEFVLPRLLTGFRETAAPSIRPQVDVTNTGRVIRALHENIVDIGFVANAQPVPGLDSLTLLHDELMVVVSADHRWAEAERVDPLELELVPFFTREEGSGTRALAIGAARELDIDLRPSLEVSSTSVLKRLVQGGAGFTIISSLAIEDERRAGTLRALHLKGAELRRPIRALRSRGERPAGVAERFWEWLKESAWRSKRAPMVTSSSG